jgi:hypothetical protein
MESTSPLIWLRPTHDVADEKPRRRGAPQPRGQVVAGGKLSHLQKIRNRVVSCVELDLTRTALVPGTKTACSHAYRDHKCRFVSGHRTGGHDCSDPKLE